jgi:hypothetical protein
MAKGVTFSRNVMWQAYTGMLMSISNYEANGRCYIYTVTATALTRKIIAGVHVRNCVTLISFKGEAAHQ